MESSSRLVYKGLMQDIASQFVSRDASVLGRALCWTRRNARSTPRCAKHWERVGSGCHLRVALENLSRLRSGGPHALANEVGKQCVGQKVFPLFHGGGGPHGPHGIAKDAQSVGRLIGVKAMLAAAPKLQRLLAKNPSKAEVREALAHGSGCHSAAAGWGTGGGNGAHPQTIGAGQLAWNGQPSFARLAWRIGSGATYSEEVATLLHHQPHQSILLFEVSEGSMVKAGHAGGSACEVYHLNANKALTVQAGEARAPVSVATTVKVSVNGHQQWRARLVSLAAQRHKGLVSVNVLLDLSNA
eukprot:78600-Amphidinium_carterae.2